MDGNYAARPYFLPADLPFDSLPEQVQAAVTGLIQPAYDELVLQASNALERAAGTTFVFLALLELPKQVELGREVAAALAQAAGATLPREAALQRCLRVIKRQGEGGRLPGPHPRGARRGAAPSGPVRHRGLPLENCDVVDQTAGDVLWFIGQHVELFSRQGTVVESWRRHRGRELGPYFRLAFREGGRQRSLYLGSLRAAADAVRQRLRELQAPRRQGQQARRCRPVLRRELARAKAVWAGELKQVGLRLHGAEVRGWSGPGKPRLTEGRAPATGKGAT